MNQFMYTSAQLKLRTLATIILSLFITAIIFAQKVNVSEGVVSLKTYPYDDPNPIPIIKDNPTIYPYFKYDGYSNKHVNKDWKIVTLENELIRVMILPEAGGKVYGAIDKTTGEEFIYKNEVMKFRNISMRGPWTSGGIEFNFGVIGHHPSTASSVDYAFGNDPDGSAYCIVGSVDLPSHTQWRVKIILKKGVANFETQASWYNPTSFRQAYYNWMTAAAPATDDLVIYAPGDAYVDHGGDPHMYPIAENGKNISKYKENDFGPSKSYHVVGSYDDYFGGYFEDSGYGFGHWSTYEDSPGQKVWFWNLSRAGGIWEDLLTDTDGQYIEFQAGRLLNQYAPESKKINPISKMSFSAGAHDRWREVWFPINGTGGITDASSHGSMHITKKDNKAILGINSFMDASITVSQITASGATTHKSADLKAMQNLQLDLDQSTVEVRIPELDLSWKEKDNSKLIERKFDSDITDSMRQASNEYTFFQGEQAYVARHYKVAEEFYLKCISRDPLHLGALASLGELYLREAKYDEAKKHLNRALEIDTYHPRSNYLIGTLYKILKDDTNALESFSWATRDIAYQSVAYSAMAEVLIRQNKYESAIEYCKKSLESNPQNVQSLLLMATAARLNNNLSLHKTALAELTKLDELHDGAQIEELLVTMDALNSNQYTDIFQGEFPDQALLECMLYYHQLGRIEEALAISKAMSDQSVMVALWVAYLENDTDQLSSIEDSKIEFVLPFRAQSLQAIDWAISHNDSWKFQYYKSLILLSLRHEEGFDIINNLDNHPDDGLFYLNRSQLLAERNNYNPIPDLETANQTSNEWRIDHYLSQNHLLQKNYMAALSSAKEAIQSDPENYIVRMDAIKALLHLEKYEEAIEIMKSTRVLPYEGASSGRILYEVAYTGHAINLYKTKKYQQALQSIKTAKIWDESMGVGKPFAADERVQDYLLSLVYTKLGMKKESKEAQDRVNGYTINNKDTNTARRLIGIKLLKDLGREDDIKEVLSADSNWQQMLQDVEKEQPSLLSNLIIETLRL